MRTLVLILCVLLSIDAAPARADDEAHSAQRLSAAPDAVYAAAGWRDGVRARVGVIAPVIDRDGGGLHVDGAVELYNAGSTDVFPYRFWRGMLAMRGDLRTATALAGYPAVVGLGVGLEHESDHETDHGDLAFATFLYANAFAVRGDAIVTLPAVVLRGAVTARVQVLSCTDADLDCTRIEQATTSASGDLELAAILRGEGVSHPCVAVHTGHIVERSSVIAETRAGIDAGLCVRGHGGDWQFLVELRIGSDTGMHRGERGTQLGAAIRWAR